MPYSVMDEFEDLFGSIEDVNLTDNKSKPDSDPGPDPGPDEPEVSFDSSEELMDDSL